MAEMVSMQHVKECLGVGQRGAQILEALGQIKSELQELGIDHETLTQVDKACSIISRAIAHKVAGCLSAAIRE